MKDTVISPNDALEKKKKSSLSGSAGKQDNALLPPFDTGGNSYKFQLYKHNLIKSKIQISILSQ